MVGICYHVLLLFVFKYLTFAAGELGLLLHKDFSAIDLSLLVGISFFTFQMMSYLFDIYHGTASAQRDPLYVGLYVALFPQLIAGPIVCYKQVAEEITDRRESYADVVDGMQRFICGLGKKVLIADYMAQLADGVFGSSISRSAATAWLGAVFIISVVQVVGSTYSPFIYFNF